MVKKEKPKRCYEEFLLSGFLRLGERCFNRKCVKFPLFFFLVGIEDRFAVRIVPLC